MGRKVSQKGHPAYQSSVAFALAMMDYREANPSCPLEALEIPEQYLREMPGVQELLSNNQVVLDFQRTAMDTPSSVEMLNFLAEEIVKRGAWRKRFDPSCRLVVIDPIASNIGQAVDENRDAELRTLLGPLADLANEMAVAIAAVKHIHKNTTGGVAHRVLGSVAFRNISR